MTRFSACLDMLFVPETRDFIDRIAMAKQAGFEQVEFWTWRDRDVGAIERALKAQGVGLAGMVAEPMIGLTQPRNHDAWLEGLRESCTVANRLGAPLLIAQAGDEIGGVPRDAQRQAIVDVLRRAAPILEAAKIVLAVEPLNTRVDHPGYYLHSTAEALDIIDEVEHPNVRILYDIYHSAVMGEAIEEVLRGRVDRVAHVHLADAPGRQEPGTGTLAWREKVDYLVANGYEGPIGLEFRPSSSTIDAIALVFPSATPRRAAAPSGLMRKAKWFLKRCKGAVSRHAQ
jgi:hydroxypyruvate isomerase